MKKIVTICLLFLMSCVSSQKSTIDREPQAETAFRKDLMDLYQNELLPKIDQSKEWRERSKKFLLMTEKKGKTEPWTAQETNAFFAEARAYIDLRASLWKIVNRHMYLVEKNVQTKVTPNIETSSSKSGDKKFILNPKDQLGKDLLFGVRISLTAALILYDNFLTGIQPHYDNPISRSRLKFDARPEFKGKFDEIVGSFLDADLRRKLARAMNLFSTDFNLKNQYQIEVPAIEANLDSQILDSPFYNFMLAEGLVSNPWSERWEEKVRSAIDWTKFVGRASTYAASFTFGNLMGTLQSRDGDLLRIAKDKTELEKLKSKLKPFDILLEKTPFRATDNFIPGYYGHAAVYLGTKKQLVEAGLWDLMVQQITKQNKPGMLKDLENGDVVLEALRYKARGTITKKDKFEGVQLNSLEHFLNIDEMLVIRGVNPLTETQKALYTENAVAQYGKLYDFNFNVNSKEYIVCSELIYVIYTDLTWPTAKSVGRFTISPDHIMAQALPGKPLKPVLMYDKNGTLKEERPNIPNYLANELFRNIQGNYSSIAYKEDSIYHETKEPQDLIHLASGIAAFQKRLEMIRGAKNTIDLEYFIYKDSTDPTARILTQELIKKAQQFSEAKPDKKIRVRILIDSSATVLKLKDDYATILKENGIKVRYYNSSEEVLTEFIKVNQRNHRKSIIVDGKEAITGGRNIGAEYFDLSPKYNFLDTDIYIKGSMAKVLEQSFEAYWYSPMSAEPNFIVARGKLGTNDPKYIKAMASAKHLITPTAEDTATQKIVDEWGPKMLAKQFTTTCTDSVFASDFPSDADAANKNSRRTFATIVGLVKESKFSLDVESPYFVLTQVGEDIFSGLLKKPGYQLNIMTNSLRSTDATYTVAAFNPTVSQWTQNPRVGVYIYKGDAPLSTYMEYPKPNGPEAIWGLHSKRAVVDRETTMIGTYNVDPRSTNLNNEMVYICRGNSKLAQNVLEDMNFRRAQSAKFNLDGTLSDRSHVFQGATRNKQAQYYIFKKLVNIPALKGLL